MARRRTLRAALTLAAALALGGCSTTQVIGHADPAPCSDDNFEEAERVLSCAEAVPAARAKLGFEGWFVSSTTFIRTWVCPMALSAVCPSARGGVVRFEIWIGSPIEVHVQLNDDSVPIASEATPATAEQ